MHDLSEAFEQNLSSYIEANSNSAPTDFKVKRELDIARHALEESLQLHAIVTKAMRSAIDSLKQSTDETAIYKLVSLANNLEERHRKLQASAKTVASIAKSGAEIESLLASRLDAAQVYSIIVQLPQLLLQLLESEISDYLNANALRLVNGSRTIDGTATVKELSHTVANRFNEEVERSVNVLTYGGNSVNGNATSSTRSGTDNELGVVEQQVVAMLSTVPVGTVLEENSPEAAALRQEGAAE